VESFGNPCVACVCGGTFTGLKKCLEKKIPFLVHGRTPFQMLRKFDEKKEDVFIDFVIGSLQEHSFENARAVYRETAIKIDRFMKRLFPDQAERQLMTDEFFINPEELDDFAPEYLGLFSYEPYDEQHIRSFLRQKISFESMATHNDCDMHYAAEYLFKRMNGMHLEDVETLTMLRHGAISRERAIEMICQPRDETVLEEGVRTMCSIIGLERKQLDSMVNRLQGTQTIIRENRHVD
jgi:hypothetical protein